jgi:AcrR family transcriptional regulator
MKHLPLISGRSRREEVIDAVALIFAARGFHGVGMREIAESLGMKAGSLYFYFRSKEEALAMICEVGFEHSLTVANRAYSENSGLEARLRALVTLSTAQTREAGDHLFVLLAERKHLSAESETRMKELSREYRLVVDQIMQDAARDGDLRDTIDVRSARLIAIGNLRMLSQYFVERIREFDSFASAAAEGLVHALCR